ncbi:unnamed protein product, partial [Trichogramma brassicae]
MEREHHCSRWGKIKRRDTTRAQQTGDGSGAKVERVTWNRRLGNQRRHMGPWRRDGAGAPEEGEPILHLGPSQWSLYIFSVYAPPRLNDAEFSALLVDITEEARGKRPLVWQAIFNAWSTEWGCSETRPRGTILLDSLSLLDAVLLNAGDTPTFAGARGASVIDLTFVSDALASSVSSWAVSDLYTHSDHQAIVFEIENTRPPIGLSMRPVRRWNARTLDADAFSTAMAGAVVPPGPAEEMAVGLMTAVTDACDASMTGAVGGRRRDPVYWWTAEIAGLRRTCLRARRLAQRAIGRPNEGACRLSYTTARHLLRAAIRTSKRRCWSRLCEEVDADVWGRPYETVMARLRGRRAKAPSSPSLVHRAVAALFPAVSEELVLPRPPRVEENVPDVTMEELQRACRRIREHAAPGPDGVPNSALRSAIAARPDIFLRVYSACLRSGVFPTCWKRQRLVLLPKPGKPPDEPSSYRPLCMLDTAGKILERIIRDRLEVFTERPGGLSDLQYGFRRERSTINAIESVVATAPEGRRRQKGGIEARSSTAAVVTLDVKNAFNSARWNNILSALRRMNVSEYLLRTITSYFSDRCARLSHGRRTAVLRCHGWSSTGLGPRPDPVERHVRRHIAPRPGGWRAGHRFRRRHRRGGRGQAPVGDRGQPEHGHCEGARRPPDAQPRNGRPQNGGSAHHQQEGHGDHHRHC